MWLKISLSIFSECKIFLCENIFQKGKHFQMFGCILKNSLENIFWCLVVILKMLKKHIFIRFLTFSQDPNKYYYRKSQYINTKIKTKESKSHERERERERERFMGDLVVATIVVTWTRWVDLRVTAWSRHGSPTVVRSRSGWLDLGIGRSHGGQINSIVGCSRWSDWL